MKVLCALENGDLSGLPPPVILQGFLKSYAQVAGLSPEEVLSRYGQLSEATPKPLAALQSVAEPKRPGTVMIVAAALILILGAAWLLLPRASQSPPPLVQSPAPAPVPPQEPPAQPPAPPVEPAAPAEEEVATTQPPAIQPPVVAVQPQAATAKPPVVAAQPQAARPQATQPPAAQPSPKPLAAPPQAARTPTAQPSVVQPQAAQQPRKHVLRARAVAQTWVRLSRDGGATHEYLLKVGEQATWEATERFMLTVGNAAGLELTLDGRPLGPLGGEGQVVSVTLPRQAAAAGR
jgi:cytoskeletal protein RodZ